MSSSHQNRSSIFSPSSSSTHSTTTTTSNTLMGSETNLSISSNTNPTLSSLQGQSANNSNATDEKPTVVLQGYLKKLKTMKKKYFVLKRDSKEGAARLEYYDSEKKFKSRSTQPKRKIYLKDSKILCRLDTKHKYVIAFQTKDESFCIVLDSEKDLNKWLRTCLQVQKGEEVTEDSSKQTFQHVWQVHVQRKGLAEEKGIIGSYNVCLTERALSLIRIGSPYTSSGEQRMASVEFFLMTIRRCGNTQIYFYLEVGRHSAIGSGELWMETEDALIASNMHTLIFNAMSESSKSRDEFITPITRNRSSSATESSKSIPINDKRRYTGPKALNTSLSPTGGTMSRGRCDSLPSRNSTTSESSNHSVHSSIMPPPRSILSNRPHSIPSGACSESDGSSISIDETDSIMHPDRDDRVMRFLSSTGTVIPEENCEEFAYNESVRNNLINRNGKNNVSLSLPISQSQSFGQRKGSPALKSNSVDTSSYIEMFSPCGCSPGDPSLTTYIPMSPGMYTGSSSAHSRASSLAEETIDGYVPMCPPQSEDYVDMDPPHSRHPMHHHHHHHHHHTTNSMSSAASSCSITSGTPSTDMRFAEYHLDKVSARFTPDDEDTSSLTDRPIRAYSVGSKLEHNKRKYRVDVLNSEMMNSRVRAYSVGSRAKVARSDLYRGVLTPSQYPTINTQDNLHNTNSINSKGKKSSSAPILNLKAHSVDPMDDLMEIDYSRKDENCTTPTSNDLSQTDDESKLNDHMEIDLSDKHLLYRNMPIKSSLPVPVPNAKRYDKNEISPKIINNHFSEYVEMKPQIHSSDPIAISNKKNEDYGYLNMKPVGVSSLSKSPSLSCSPIKSISSPKTVPLTSTSFSSSLNKSSNFMDLSSRSLDKIQNFSHDDKTVSQSPKTTSVDYLNMRPGQNMDLPKTISAPEGYMEMSWGKESRNINNNNTISEKPSSDEYINMNFKRSPESRVTTSSLPITIQNRSRTSFNNGPILSTPKNQSTTIYSTFNNTNNGNSSSPDKSSTRMRCESKDSGIVTPSGSQATIFPFSPSSPVKNIDTVDSNQFARKCLVDGTTGTIRLSEEDEGSDETGIGISKLSSSVKSKENEFIQTPTQQVDRLSSNYADMSLYSNQRKPNSLNLTNHIEEPDYVNCAPSNINSITPKPISPCTTPQVVDDDAGEYAFVDPTKKVNVPAPSPGVLPLKKSLITISNNQEKLISFGSSFKPISSNSDELLSRNTNYINKAGSPKPMITSALNRHLTEKRSNTMHNSNLSDDYLVDNNKKLLSSRPNSVNSEKISSKNSISNSSLNRPNSANSDRLPFISASSSSSTLCGSSSSSSTLCGSKSQSPSTSSTNRPQSLGDIGGSSGSGGGGGCNSSGNTSCISSRPDSVTSMPDSHIISSRPPSVSSERELHYASLDLPPPSANRTDERDDLSKCGNNNNNNCDSSSSPSPNTSGSSSIQPTHSAFTYAQIDFVKSEHLKTKQLTK